MPEWEGLQSNAQLLRQLMLQEGVGWNAVVTTAMLPRDNHLLGRQLGDVRPPPPLLVYGMECFTVPFTHVKAPQCFSPLTMSPRTLNHKPSDRARLCRI